MTIASDYVQKGMALIAIPTGKKSPITSGWNKADNAIVGQEKARTLTGNIGIAHAYSTPPTMALDIDDLNRANVWLAERGVVLAALLDADDAVQICSGRCGRAKLLYRLPSDLHPVPTKQISDAQTGEMVLEFRCASANGLTVQDVLPPSIHPETGRPYQWGGKGSWRNIPEIPKELLAIWQAGLIPTAVSSAALGTTVDDSSVITLPPETIQHLRSALMSMRADDYDLWIKCGMALKSLGDVGRGLWLEWSLTSEKSLHE